MTGLGELRAPAVSEMIKTSGDGVSGQAFAAVVVEARQRMGRLWWQEWIRRCYCVCRADECVCVVVPPCRRAAGFDACVHLAVLYLKLLSGPGGSCFGQSAIRLDHSNRRTSGQ